MVLLTATAALAVTPKDLIELTRAGLSDDVLVALIEADQGGVRLDAAQILMMRNAGVSERVILALLQEQRRQADAAAAAAAIESQAVEPAPVPEPVAAPAQTAPVVIQQQVPVAVPIFIPWRPVHPAAVSAPAVPRSGFGRFINDGWVNGTLPGGRR
jgi:hypothetical protein